jgi:hypothetical protein
MKKLVSILILVLLVAACSKEQPKPEADPQPESPEVVTITFDEFKANPESYVDKYVKIEGTCIHTCKHGGKKMHIVGADPDYRMTILASDKVAMFDKELEGSGVIVEGYVRVEKIDEAYLNNWEAELKADVDKQKEAGSVDEEHHENLDKIAHLREQLKETGKDVIANYSIECQKFEEKAVS